MTPRERSDEIVRGWYSPEFNFARKVDALRDRIEAAIIAATEDAEARAEAAEKALQTVAEQCRENLISHLSMKA